MLKIENSRYTTNLTNKNYAIQKLLGFGADLMKADRKDRITPLEYARRSGQVKLFKKV